MGLLLRLRTSGNISVLDSLLNPISNQPCHHFFCLFVSTDPEIWPAGCYKPLSPLGFVTHLAGIGTLWLFSLLPPKIRTQILSILRTFWLIIIGEQTDGNKNSKEGWKYKGFRNLINFSK